MTAIHWIIAAAALAFVQTAQAATTDPEVIIYRFPGVRATGGDFTGAATVFHCTNFSGVPETIRLVTRDGHGELRINFPIGISHLITTTFSTQTTAAYASLSMATGTLNSGTTAIAATSINIICTAMTIDASTVVPVGVALRGIRFSPVPGSQE